MSFDLNVVYFDDHIGKLFSLVDVIDTIQEESRVLLRVVFSQQAIGSHNRP